MAGSTLWRRANMVMLVLFLFSVVVQFNDPDPLVWAAIYGAAAVACLLELRGQGRWWIALPIALVATAWALGIAPHVIGIVPFGDMFEAFEMKDAGVEESREMYGLWIVTAWMVAVLIHALRPGSTRRTAG